MLIASGWSQPLGPSPRLPVLSCSAGTLATVPVRSHTGHTSICAHRCRTATRGQNPTTEKSLQDCLLYSEGIQSQCSVFSYLPSFLPTLPSGDHVIRETVLCTCFCLHSVLGFSPILVNLIVFFAHVEYYPKVKTVQNSFVFREMSLPSLFPPSCSLHSS